MKKSIFIILLSIIILFNFFSCEKNSSNHPTLSQHNGFESQKIVKETLELLQEPKTGEATLSFSEKFYLSEEGYYLVNIQDRSIKFRDYVKVNNETTWVVSKKADGSNPINTFSTYLSAGKSDFYIVCSDRIGIANSYKVSFYAESNITNIFYTEFDYDTIEKKYLEGYKNSLGTGFSSRVQGTYIGSFSQYINNGLWDTIIEHREILGATFYKEVSGTSFKSSSAFPPPPEKDGMIFKGWEQLYAIYDKPALQSSKTIGDRTYTLYIAKWEVKE